MSSSRDIEGTVVDKDKDKDKEIEVNEEREEMNRDKTSEVVSDSDLMEMERSKTGETASSSSQVEAEEEVAKRCLSRVRFRTLPLLFLCSFLFFNYRLQIAFTANAIMDDLDIDAAQLGWAISSFFVPYAALQLPLSLLAARIGARRSLAAILVAQGIISALTASIQSYWALVCVRAVQGTTVSAFIPILQTYLAKFFGKDGMSNALALSFVLGGQLAPILPISALLLYVSSFATTIADWRLYYLIWGAPSLLLAIPVFSMLPDSPHEAKRFLNDAEYKWLIEKTNANEEMRSQKKKESTTNDDSDNDGGKQSSACMPILRIIACDVRVILLAIINLTTAASMSGLLAWQPTLLSKEGEENELGMAMSALLNAIPHAVALPFLLLYARHSDKTGERIWHALGGEAVVAIGFLLASMLLRTESPSTVLELATLATVVAGDGMFITPFLAFSPDILPAATAATGIALVTIGGSVGNVVGPSVVGSLLDVSGGFFWPLFALLCLVLLSLGLLVVLLCVVRQRRRRDGLLMEVDEIEGKTIELPQTHEVIAS